MARLPENGLDTGERHFLLKRNDELPVEIPAFNTSLKLSFDVLQTSREVGDEFMLRDS